MNTNNDVLFEEMQGIDGDLGIITLNRPDVLNPLNHRMVQAMHDQLKIWATSLQIKAVVIRAAEGRAFCAGGDLRLTYDRFVVHDPALAHFFRDEYQLNRFIYHFPKPYIALLDGITMGGGVGISIHGSHRVATERLVFAMPETGIGFFPDVGGTYFLPRLAHYSGYYLGLMGARISSDDCVALGIAQQKVQQDCLPQLIEQLAQQSFGDHASNAVTRIIESFKTEVKSSLLIEQQAAIEICFSQNSMEEISRALNNSSASLCQEAAAIINKKSPTSLKVTLRALQEGRKMNFDACMRQEFRLCCRFLQGKDFVEGIRAVIIDKDQSPHWNPNTLAGVTPQIIENYFAPLAQELV